MLESVATLQFDPLLPAQAMAALVVCFACLSLLWWLRRKSFPALRVVLAGVLAALILNPSLRLEERRAEKDIVLVAADRSASMGVESRSGEAQAARDYLSRTLSGMPSLEARFIDVAAGLDGERQTRPFETLSAAMADIPADRRAGVVLITDGQIHDAQAFIHKQDDWGPMQVLLTGSRRQTDRRIVIMKAPAYGLRGQSVNVTFKVEDQGAPQGKSAAVSLQSADGQTRDMNVTVGEEINLQVDLPHAGPNIFEITTPPLTGEITTVNNSAALTINGVRDRLRVLLVSGQPYQGTRAWRDLLKSDPGVDLVHFTILREPDRIDPTPPDEVSLIAFPFRELFEEKLSGFDLIIFDRYRHNQILPDFYFRNIADYVRAGGALLVQSGPEFAAPGSIYATAMGEILPGAPGPEALSRPFKPALTQSGAVHPVTQNLGNSETQTAWGNWMRMVPLTLDPKFDADTVMQGPDQRPLLVLARVDKGRVAQLASDTMWLWQKGYDGGPSTELLRRLIHWLMKEPSLDERALKVDVQGRDIAIRARAVGTAAPSLKITDSQGKTQERIMQPVQAAPGLFEANITDASPGIWRFEGPSGEKSLAVSGDMTSPEMQSLGVTDKILRAPSAGSGGGIIWLGDAPQPKILHKPRGQGMAGGNWIGLRRNNAYSLTGYSNVDLIPPWLALALLIGAALCVWMREARR